MSGDSLNHQKLFEIEQFSVRAMFDNRLQSPMSHLATLRLRFPGNCVNEYRLQENGVEFLTGNGTWRILEESDLQFHFVLHSEVAGWLLRHSVNANPHPLHTR